MGSLRDLELFARLADSRSVLIAGAGGGFDVFAGIPLALAHRDHLRSQRDHRSLSPRSEVEAAASFRTERTF
jgi:hypothetical protein